MFWGGNYGQSEASRGAMQIATQPLAQSVRVQRKWQTLWKLSVPNFQWRAKIQKPGRFQNPKWNSESVKKVSQKSQFRNSVCRFLINRLLNPNWSILDNCYGLAPSIHAAFVRHEAKEQWLDDAQTYAIDGTEGSHPTQVLAVFHHQKRDPRWEMFIQGTDTYPTWRKGISSTQTWQTRYSDSSRRFFLKSSSLIISKTPANRT